MKLIIGPRRSGKTTELVRWLRENPKRLLAVVTMQEATRLRRIVAKDVAEQIVTLDDARTLTRSRPPGVEVAIDNLDWALLQLLGFMPTVATATTIEVTVTGFDSA